MEVPVEIAERVETVLVKTRSSDQMLTEAIDAFVTRNNLVSSGNGQTASDNRTQDNG
jgi:hypothetical protein